MIAKGRGKTAMNGDVSKRSDDNGGGESQRGSFPSTAWAKILSARDAESDERREVLDELISAYWGPVYSAIRYGWRVPEHEAKDLAQGFFLQLLQRDFLRYLAPEKGKFRSFLKKALRNYLLNRKRDEERLKRSGGGRLVFWTDFDGTEVPETEPEEASDRAWVEAMISKAVEALRVSLLREGREDYFRIFELHDLGGSPLSYREVAKRMGLSENDVRNRLHYVRKRVRLIVISQVWEFSSDDQEFRDDLRQILARPIQEPPTHRSAEEP